MTVASHQWSARFGALLASTSLIALLAPISASGQATSSCTDSTPDSGDTVTCTFVLQDGDAVAITEPIVAPGSTDVTVVIDGRDVDEASDTIAALSGTPAINLGAGATITVLDAGITNGLDFEDLGDGFFLLLADAGIETAQDLVDFLNAEGVDATIEIDAFGNEEVVVPEGQEIAATRAFASVAGPATGDVVVLGAGAPNLVTLGDNDPLDDSEGAIVAVGASGVRTAAGGETQIDLPGGLVSVIGESGAGVLVESGVLRITTEGDPDEVGGGVVVAGDGAAAVRTLGEANAVIVDTTNAGFVSVGNDTATLDLDSPRSAVDINLRFNDAFTDEDIEIVPGIGANTALLSAGDNAPVIKSIGDESIFSLRASVDSDTLDVGFGSAGSNSPIIRREGANSIASVLLLNLSLTTLGDQSPVFDLAEDSNSTLVLELSDLTISTEGEGSGVFDLAPSDGGGESDLTLVIGETEIVTSGGASIGLEFNQSGGAPRSDVNSSLTVQTTEIRTSGDGTPAFVLNGLIDDGVLAVALVDTSLATSGEKATGAVIDASVTGSGESTVAVEGVDISTSGASAVGLDLTIGVDGDGSSTFAMADSTVTTTGDLADGILVSDIATRTGAAAATLSTATLAPVGEVSTTAAVSGAFSYAFTIGEGVTGFTVDSTVDPAGDGSAEIVFDHEAFAATSEGGREIVNNGTIFGDVFGLSFEDGEAHSVTDNGLISSSRIDDLNATAVSFGAGDDLFELQAGSQTVQSVNGGGGGQDVFVLGGDVDADFDVERLGTQFLDFELNRKAGLSTWTLSGVVNDFWTIEGGSLVVTEDTFLGGRERFLVTGGRTRTFDAAMEMDVIVDTFGQLVLDDSDVIVSALGANAIQIEGQSMRAPDAPLAERGDIVLLGDTVVQSAREAAIRSLGDGDVFTVTMLAETLGAPTLRSIADDMAALSIDGTGSTVTVIAANPTGGAPSTAALIQTLGDDAPGIGGGGGTDLTVDADSLQLLTEGAGSAGISLVGDGISLDVTNARSDDAPALAGPLMATEGFDAPVIEVLGDGADVAVTLDLGGSRVETTGQESDVLKVEGSGNTVSVAAFNGAFSTTERLSRVLNLVDTGDGANITVTTSGNTFSTTGDSAEIFRFADNGGGSTVILTSTADEITTTGDFAAGIDVDVSDGRTARISLIDGSIMTGGAAANGLEMIEPASQGGTTVLNLLGQSITTTGDDALGVALDARATGGSDATVTFGATGSGGMAIATEGNSAAALRFLVGADDSSTSTVSISDTAFSTAGTLSPGVDLISGVTGPGASLDVRFADTTIDTTGAESTGLILSPDLDDIAAALDLGNLAITTAGAGSHGIELGANSTLAFAGSIETALDGAIGVLMGPAATLDMSGTIDTLGEGSSGIWLEDTGTVTLSGAITTAGVLAYGIGGEGRDFDVTVTDTGTIDTTGTWAAGIWLDYLPGSLATGTIVMDGRISTTGDFADGVAVGYDRDLGGKDTPDGNAGVVTVGGLVETTGTESHGLSAYLTSNALATFNVTDGGVVDVSGTDASGIYIRSGGNSAAVARAVVTIAEGAQVSAVDAAGVGEGNETPNSPDIETTLTIAGTLEGGGTDALAADLRGGDDTIIVLPTAVIVGGVDLGEGDDTLIFDGAVGTVGDIDLIAETATFAVDVESIEKRGQGTWIFGGIDVPADVDFAPGRVVEGISILTADFASFDASTGPAGRLESDGDAGVGDFTNEGSFAPGGTGAAGDFSVAGDLVFTEGGTFEVDIFADGSSDLVTALGAVTLGGTLVVNAENFPAGFPPTQDYVILTAPDPLAGEFAEVTDNLPDLAVEVTVTDAVADDPGTEADETAPSTVVVSYGQDVENVSDKSIIPNSLQASHRAARAFNDTLIGRSVTTRSAGGLAIAHGEGARLSAKAGPGGQTGAVWAMAFGAFADVDGTGDNQGYDTSGGGAAVGFEILQSFAGADLTLGIAGGFTRTGVDSGASDARLNSGSVGIYAGAEIEALRLDAAITATFHGGDIDRRIDGTDLTAEGDADGRTISAMLDVSYDVAPALGLGQGTRLAPVVGVEYVSTRRDGYEESGAGAFNLDVDEDTLDQTFFSAGVMAETAIAAGDMVIRPGLDLRYERLIGERNTTSSSVLSAIGGAGFVDPGALEGRDRLSIAAGVAVDVSERWSASIGYQGEIAGSSTAHGVQAGVMLKF